MLYIIFSDEENEIGFEDISNNVASRLGFISSLILTQIAYKINLIKLINVVNWHLCFFNCNDDSNNRIKMMLF